MPDYRRNRVPGGTFFFTANLLDRRSDLLVTQIDALRDAVRQVRARAPFHIDAWVVLPDHLHCLWTPASAGEAIDANLLQILNGFCAGLSGRGPAASGAQQPVPNGESQENGERADDEKRGYPALRCLRLAADTDHYSRDLIGALRLGAPEAILPAAKTNLPSASVRPVITGVLASPGANTCTSAFAIGLPSWVANCTVTSCVANRSKAAEGSGTSAAVRIRTTMKANLSMRET